MSFLFISVGMNYAQSITVTGTVTDGSSGTGLPGVNVLEKGTTNGTITDLEGNYTINVSSQTSILEFSFIGYLTETITVNDQTQVNVTLAEDIAKLDEVVVIGYGTQKKSDLTGSVAVVNTENLEKIASSDISKVLQGQTSGVQVFGSGEPGAQQRVQIRGIGTFGNSQPLYVIDGVPVANATNVNISGQSMLFENHAPGYGSGAPSGGISDFDPSNIESVQILKDASAAAIYGARGANGVVIITTKRGKAGNVKINYGGSYGVSNVVKRMDLTNTLQFQEINNQARRNDGTFIARVNNPQHALYISPDSIDTDWQKEFFEQGYITDHSLSFQGGSENNTYYASVNYFDEMGTAAGPGPRFTKYGVQLNMDQKKGRFKFGQSFFYSHSNQVRLTSTRWNNIMTELVIAIPIVQLHDTANLEGWGGGNSNYLQIAGNPVAFNNLAEVTFSRNRFFGVVYGEVELFKGLSYKLNLSYDRSDWNNKEFVPDFNVGNRHTWEIPMLSVWRGESPHLIMENLLNYNKIVGKHDVSAVLGYTAQKDHISDLYAHAEGYVRPFLKEISAVSSGQSSKGTLREHAMLSYLARLNYNFADKYLFTGTIRRDYSSNFGPLNKYGDFWNFALGWKISSESFFNVPSITLLKLRGGWGEIGNEFIEPYLYETTVNNAVNYVFNNVLTPGTTQTVAVDPGIKWEERITGNIGFDLNMFKNKIEFSAEYYHNTANDILFRQPLPISSGAIGWEIASSNVASMINQGFEFNLSYKKFEGVFHYSVSGNFTTLKNEVTKLSDDKLPYITGTSRTDLGRSMGELYGYQMEGIFQSMDQINTVTPTSPTFDPAKHAYQHVQTRPGDIIFKDLNSDGIINEEDQTYLGQVIPKYNYGLNISADYKGFDFSIFIQGLGGNKVYNDLYRAMNTLGEGNYSVESYENYWRDDADDTNDRFSNKWPRPTVNDNNGNNRVSDRWIQDGGYLKLQNVMLGYTIPASVIGKVRGIGSIRIYLQAQNVFAISKLDLYDPDFINDGNFNRGFAGGSYPTPRTIMAGIKLSL